MGDSHVYRGFNVIHQRDLGNFLAEQADASDAKSLHIMVLGIQGEHVLYSGYQRPLKHVQDTTIGNEEYLWLKPAMDLALKDNWTLYDLRKLRFGKAASLSPDWERVVYGYDLLIVIPELTPADLIR